MQSNNTIFALSTPLGNGVAVIRISGEGAEQALRRCFSRQGEYADHMLYYGRVLDRESGECVDEAMAVLMRAPKSYTGEDTAELHCHGSRAVVARVFELLLKTGLRQARPGEFSQRAFCSGRMDLSQAEAVMDLIHAQADLGAQAALAQLRGVLSQEVSRLQDALTDAIARLEAGIDYPQEDWQDDISRDVLDAVLPIEKRLKSLHETGKQGCIVREGYALALVGRPNVGKSTLFNVLLGRERAIVTDLPGTTRDVLEEEILMDGLLVRLIDTAGLHEDEQADLVERMGMELAREQMKRADLVLLLLDGSRPLMEQDKAVITATVDFPRLLVITKGDLPQMLDTSCLPGAYVRVSAKQDGGLDELKSAVMERFDQAAPNEPMGVMVTNARHMEAVRVAGEACAEARTALELQDLDCATIDLRRAWHFLGEITGETLDEAIVDRIFSTFCLGK